MIGQRNAARSLGVNGARCLAVVVLCCMSFSCQKSPTVDAEVVDATGNVVTISGKQKEVASLKVAIHSLQDKAADSSRWYHEFKHSEHPLDAPTAELEKRWVRESCNQILSLCDATRRNPELTEMIQASSGADKALDSYEEQAREMLAGLE